MGLDETMGKTLDNVLSLPRRDEEPVIRFGGWDQWRMGHGSAPIDRHCADLILKFLLVLGAGHGFKVPKL